MPKRFQKCFLGMFFWWPFSPKLFKPYRAFFSMMSEGNTFKNFQIWCTIFKNILLEMFSFRVTLYQTFASCVINETLAASWFYITRLYFFYFQGKMPFPCNSAVNSVILPLKWEWKPNVKSTLKENCRVLKEFEGRLRTWKPVYAIIMFHKSKFSFLRLDWLWLRYFVGISVYRWAI